MSLKVGPIVAAKLFLKDAKLPMTYIEAVANSMDWGATAIQIDIKQTDPSKPSTLSMLITDNGTGIDKSGFDRFSNLSKPLDEAHRGLGRLAYVANFNKVTVKTQTKNEARQFVFDNNFDDKKVKPTEVVGQSTGTILELSEYSKQTIHSKAFIRPEGVRDILLKTFYPSFYERKRTGTPLVITITLVLGSGSDELIEPPIVINVRDLPELKEVPFDPTPAIMFQDMTLGYHIDKNYPGKLLIAGFNIDGRSMIVDNIMDDSIPINTKAVFILSGKMFEAQTDDTRQEIKIEELVLRELKKRFAQEVDKLLKEHLPLIRETNVAIQEEIVRTFPHLETYFDTDAPGILNRERVVEEATWEFMKDQKHLLEAEHLDGEALNEAMDMSARILMGYILLREKTLNKLDEISDLNRERAIHNLIAPTNKKEYNGHDDEIYTNNAWVLDEKFMTYSYMLSDKQLKTFIEKVYPEADASHISGEPDIAVLLSKENTPGAKVDIVVVEMKRLNLEISDEMHVVTQLYERASAILEFFKGDSQRLWLYGIAEVSERMALMLDNQQWSPLYSAGQYWHKTDRIRPRTSEVKVPTSFYIMPYRTLVADAKQRNATFMNLLRRSISKSHPKEK